MLCDYNFFVNRINYGFTLRNRSRFSFNWNRNSHWHWINGWRECTGTGVQIVVVLKHHVSVSDGLVGVAFIQSVGDLYGQVALVVVVGSVHSDDKVAIFPALGSFAGNGVSNVGKVVAMEDLLSNGLSVSGGDGDSEALTIPGIDSPHLTREGDGVDVGMPAGCVEGPPDTISLSTFAVPAVKRHARAIMPRCATIVLPERIWVRVSGVMVYSPDRSVDGVAVVRRHDNVSSTLFGLSRDFLLRIQ